jgi:hypothetical protein
MYEFFMEEHFEPVGSKLKSDNGDFYSPALYLKKHLSEEVSRMLTKSL